MNIIFPSLYSLLFLWLCSVPLCASQAQVAHADATVPLGVESSIVDVSNAGSEDDLAMVDLPIMTRTDNLTEDSFVDATDPYLEGYIQALVDMHYYEYRVQVTVQDHHVILSNLPANALTAESIVAFVKDLPGVLSVAVAKDVPAEEKIKREHYVEAPRLNGLWFPQTTVLFAPLVADPRQPCYSGAFRFWDEAIGSCVSAVSLGDDFPIYRWRDVFRWHGDLQIAIESGVWTVFNYTDVPDVNGEWCELVNADYLGGIILTYAVDRWSYRFRTYHISSHLGDEYLVNHPDLLDTRTNPSMEAIDLFLSYQFASSLRGYGGLGAVIHSDVTFPMKALYIQYGFEARLLGTTFNHARLYGTPFLAVHAENWEARNWDFDYTIKLGYECSKLQGVGRKVRIYVDYHYGYSYEGQFFYTKTSYAEVGGSWGF